MSKKLIAVSAAFALALTGLVGIAPANATTSLAGGTGDGLAATTATVIPVPSDNEVDTGDLITYTVSSAAAKTVTATATGGVKLLLETTDAAGDDFPASAGTQSISQSTGAATSVTIYAFTTSTTTGTVVINDGIGNTQTFYVKGSAGDPYNIKVTAPQFVGAGQNGKVDVVVTDVFGNAIVTNTASRLDSVVSGFDINGTVVGGDASILTDSQAFTYDTIRKAYVGNIVGRTTSGQIALSVSLTSSDAAITKVIGLADPVDSFFAVLNGGDQTATITALQAQVAALTAQLAESRPKATSVTKKRFNTLARKWNAANPGARVALKK
jgi:hypothetical protein